MQRKYINGFYRDQHLARLCDSEIDPGYPSGVAAKLLAVLKRINNARDVSILRLPHPQKAYQLVGGGWAIQASPGYWVEFEWDPARGKYHNLRTRMDVSVK